MFIYSFYPNGEKAVTLSQLSPDYFESHFVGRPMVRGWQPPQLRILDRKMPLRDFVSWDLSVMVVTTKGKTALEPLLSPHVEFLSLTEVKGQKLFAINVIEVLDCLNRDASNITYSPDDPNRIIYIEKFVFAPQRLKKVPIFKVPEWPGLIFVSEDFARLVVHANLDGAGFDDPEAIPFVKSPWDGTMEGLPKVRPYII